MTPSHRRPTILRFAAFRNWGIALLGLAVVGLNSACSVLRSSEAPSGVALDQPECKTQKDAGTPAAAAHSEPKRKTLERLGRFYFLPKLVVTVQGSMVEDAAKNPIYKITVTPQYEADDAPEARYYLRWTPDAFGSDSIKALKVNAAGLIESVDVSAEDKSLAVLADVVGIAGKVFRIGAGLPAKALINTERTPFTVVFNPFNDEERQDAINVISEHALMTMSIAPESLFPPKNSGKKTDGKGTVNPRVADSGIPGDSRGVLYHPPVALALIFKDDVAVTKPRFQRVSLIAPDPNTILCVPFTRASFVEKKQKVTFVNGMPSDLELTQPSVANGLTQGLKSIVDAVGSLIPTIVNVKTEQAQASADMQKALLEAQAAALEAKLKLLKAEAQLDAYEKPVPAATPAAKAAPAADADKGLNGVTKAAAATEGDKELNGVKSIPSGAEPSPSPAPDTGSVPKS